METSRRSFLKGILALGVISAVPSAVFAKLPVIYGDGVHDDAPGLNAMLAGEPFEVEAEGIVARDGVISGGRFLMSRGLILSRPHIYIENCLFKAGPDFDRDTVWVDARNTSGSMVANCFFDGGTSLTHAVRHAA